MENIFNISEIESLRDSIKTWTADGKFAIIEVNGDLTETPFNKKWAEKLVVYDHGEYVESLPLNAKQKFDGGILIDWKAGIIRISVNERFAKAVEKAKAKAAKVEGKEKIKSEKSEKAKAKAEAKAEAKAAKNAAEVAEARKNYEFECDNCTVNLLDIANQISKGFIAVDEQLISLLETRIESRNKKIKGREDRIRSLIEKWEGKIGNVEAPVNVAPVTVQ